MGDFQTQSVAFGYDHCAFSHLSNEDKEKIICLLSRVSEQSFRRGFQHGCYMQEKGTVKVRPDVWRFDAPFDDSPDPDSLHGRSVSIRQRLFDNYSVLADLGLPADP